MFIACTEHVWVVFYILLSVCVYVVGVHRIIPVDYAFNVLDDAL